VTAVEVLTKTTEIEIVATTIAAAVIVIPATAVAPAVLVEIVEADLALVVEAGVEVENGVVAVIVIGIEVIVKRGDIKKKTDVEVRTKIN
jgi:hypothetical protein